MKCRIICLVLMTLLLASCGNDNKQEHLSESTTQTESEAGTSSTEEPYILTFKGITIDGELMDSDYFGKSKLTMINVWATYCPPCIKEMPDLGEIADEYDRTEFQILGIISDVMEGADKEGLEKAKTIISDTKADYPHLLLNVELYQNLVGASSSVPTSYFFNQEGELLGYIVGAQSKETWCEIIDQLLEQLD